MTISVDELATKAMSLSGEARALLAEKIVESLDQEALHELWLTEAKRRRDEVRSGRVKPIPGAEPINQVMTLAGRDATVLAPQYHLPVLPRSNRSSEIARGRRGKQRRGKPEVFE